MENELPEEIEGYFSELEHELTLLHFKWNVFNQLFTKSKERVEILNITASHFFVLFQNMLIDDLQLSVCKLTEFHTTGSNKNLSFEVLINSIDDQHESLKKGLREIFAALRIKAKPFRNSRNKVIGHLDFETFVQGKIQELKSFKFEEIQEVLLLGREFLNTFKSYFWNRTTHFENQFSMNDGDALIAHLKRAIHYEELVQNRKIKPYSHFNSKYKNA